LIEKLFFGGIPILIERNVDTFLLPWVLICERDLVVQFVMDFDQEARARIVGAFQPASVIEPLLLRPQPCRAALGEAGLVHVEYQLYGRVLYEIVKAAIGRVLLIVFRIRTEELAEVGKSCLVQCDAGDDALLCVHIIIRRSVALRTDLLPGF